MQQSYTVNVYLTIQYYSILKSISGSKMIIELYDPYEFKIKHDHLLETSSLTGDVSQSLNHSFVEIYLTVYNSLH